MRTAIPYPVIVFSGTLLTPMVMAVGFPLSHPAPQPERTAQLPVANELLLRQAPHGLQPVNTDRWYYRVFQSAPDLIRSLLPGSDAAAKNELGLDPAIPGDRLYRFEALEIKELSHRLAAQS